MPLLSNITYEPFGPVNGWIWGNGTSHQRLYDTAGRLLSWSLPGDQRQLSYDTTGNVIQRSDSRLNGMFAYDALNRLTAANDSMFDQSLGYDKNGNRLQFTDNGTVSDYTYAMDSNRLSQAGADLYTLDANGNTTQDGKHSYAFDADNRLVAVDNGTITYRYNALGQRVAKTRLTTAEERAAALAEADELSATLVELTAFLSDGSSPTRNLDCDQNQQVDSNDGACLRLRIRQLQLFEAKDSVTVYYSYDQQGHLIGAYYNPRFYIQETAYFGDRPVLRLDTGLHYIHTDALNTPRAISSTTTDTVIWRWDSDPFGATAANEDPDGDGIAVTFNLRFAGQYYDKETGLHYNWNRYYDPRTGRYITSDPTGLAGGLNTYLYTLANPIRFIDPLGLVVQGSWIQPPKFNIQDVGIDNWTFVSPTFSAWGYLKFIRLQGHAFGYINIDVKCTDDCKEWEVHNKVSVDAQGTFDVGPNLYALGAGFAAGPYVGIATNIAIAGAVALQVEHHFLSLAQQNAGPLISTLIANGPTLICLGTNK